MKRALIILLGLLALCATANARTGRTRVLAIRPI